MEMRGMEMWRRVGRRDKKGAQHAFLLPCSGRKNRGRAHRSDTPGVPGASLGS